MVGTDERSIRPGFSKQVEKHLLLCPIISTEHALGIAVVPLTQHLGYSSTLELAFSNALGSLDLSCCIKMKQLI